MEYGLNCAKYGKGSKLEKKLLYICFEEWNLPK
jgi:hypothetical protein